MYNIDLLRLDDDLLESLDAEVQEVGVSRSEYIRVVLLAGKYL